MSNLLIKAAIRSLFVLTSRSRAKQRAQRILENPMKLAVRLSRENGSRSIEVPPMRGADEDMRKWSFYMILEHNEIVNRSISATVRQLARGEPPGGPATIDPKTGVMPSISAGEQQLPRFRNSVNDHLKVVNTLGRLRGTKTSPHPVFGEFDAHKWNCMFSFHLNLHLKKAEYDIRTVKPIQICV